MGGVLPALPTQLSTVARNFRTVLNSTQPYSTLLNSTQLYSALLNSTQLNKYCRTCLIYQVIVPLVGNIIIQIITPIFSIIYPPIKICSNLSVSSAMCMSSINNISYSVQSFGPIFSSTLFLKKMYYNNFYV